VKVGTLLKDKWRDDNLYVIAGEEGYHKESGFQHLKTVKIYCLTRNAYRYPVRRIVESDFEVLSP